MRLVLLGGGGFRTPLVHGALVDDLATGRGVVDELVLHDVDPARLAVMERVLHGRAAGRPAPRLTTTTDLDTALDGADVVFSAIRVGGLEGRTCDERVALDLGVLGQETTGPGGLAFGLRTLPVVLDIGRRVRERAPDAWFINFTNPAGMMTQALRSVLGDRAIGICDSPVGLGRRAARAAGVPDAHVGYAGLNHLGWLTSLTGDDGTDHLPALLADPEALLRTEEGRLFGVDWLQALGAVPNEYLYYYDFTREAVASIRGAAQTRGEFLLDQQARFYAAAARSADPARLWERTVRERNETYMAESREEDEERDEEDLSGGYEKVAVALMRSLLTDEEAHLVLDVRNAGAIPGLADDDVVEVPCVVTASGARPHRPGRLDPSMLALVEQVKAVEHLTIDAARTGDPRLALRAFAAHPLVDSVSVARELLAGYRARIPALDDVLHR